MNNEGLIPFVSNFANKFYIGLKNVFANNTIIVDGFRKDDTNSILINNPFYKKGLFCVELSGTSNVTNHLKELDLNSLYNKFRYSKDGFLFWAMMKKKNFQRNYIFSYNKAIVEYIANYYGTKIVSGEELLNVLYDLQLDNQYVVDKKEKTIKRKLDLTDNINYEFINYQYNNIVKDSVFENLSSLNVYQATHYIKNDKPTDISKLYSLDFTGVVWTYMSFNINTATTTINGWLTNAKNAATGEKRKLEIFKKEIETKNSHAVTMNSVLFITKETDNEFMNANIGDCLNVVFKREKEGRAQRRDLIRYTPLIFRNPKWNKVLPLDYAYKYIGSVHKELSPEAHIYGRDINGAFTNYNLKATTPSFLNTRPHIFIGGKTGSTKTTTVNAMIGQMIDFDWDTDKIGDFKGIKIRQFDIKDSLGAYARHVNKHNPSSVDIIEADLNEFSYNLININRDEKGNLDENDISFCKQTTSFILHAKTKGDAANSGLTFDEDALYGKIIVDIYENNEWEDITIEELAAYQPNLAQEIRDKGYSDDDELRDIKEKEYAFLQKPTLGAVVKKLNLLIENRDVRDDITQLSTVQNLRKKITTVASFGAKTDNKTGIKVSGFFDRYERTNIDSSKQWLLFNMDKVKDLDEYAPIQWILLNKIAHEDKKNQLKLRHAGEPEPLILYFIEEAHNMLKNPLFRSTDEQRGILDKPALEWRSYNMVLALVSQESSHIPKGVYDSIETKFFLFPEPSDDDSGEGIDKQVNEIVDLLGLSEEVKSLLLNTPRYHACAINEHGAFVIGLPTTEKMRKVFDGKYYS